MRVIIFVLLALLTNILSAQVITGSWYGVAEANTKGPNVNNYMTELVLKQKGNEVEGIFGYYFRSGYQSFYIRGTYNPATRILRIKNLPLSHYRNRDIDGIECPMDFSATLMVSKVQSRLTGTFTSHSKYKYTCPELSFVSMLDRSDKNQDSVINAGSVSKVKKYWQPRGEELVINTKDLNTGMSTKADSTSQQHLPATDSARTTDPATGAVAKDSMTAPGVRIDSTAFKAAEAARRLELEKLKTSFSERKTIVSTEVPIEGDSVRISFYDNGDIDGDSIAVFINKVPVLSKQPLTERALNIYLAMDKAHPVNEISMYAENLGKYPPNTALMVITDGNKRKEVFLSSSLTQNSSVILRKVKPAN